MTAELTFKKLSPRIGELAINNIARRNALTEKMWRRLPGLLSEIAMDQGLRSLIITGEGEHFCAGADISEFETLYATPESAASISSAMNAAFAAVADFPLPVIAAIRGACMGGGCAIACAADIRFADETARFAVPPAKLALLYPFNDLKRLHDLIGPSRAKDLVYSGRTINAAEAFRIGLVDQVVETSFGTTVLEYAQSFNPLSGESQQIMKEMFARIAAGQETENEATRRQFTEAFSTKDFREGYTAFLEKRKPEY